MFRRFKFEAEASEPLGLVPMTVRRKLDRIGVKIGLEQWRALGYGDRLAICHLPAESADEREAMRVFVIEAVKRTSGAGPKMLADSDSEAAEPPHSPPAPLVERAKELGFVIDGSLWERLDADERYTLVKMGAGSRASHDLPAALQELVGKR